MTQKQNVLQWVSEAVEACDSTTGEPEVSRLTLAKAHFRACNEVQRREVIEVLDKRLRELIMAADIVPARATLVCSEALVTTGKLSDERKSRHES